MNPQVDSQRGASWTSGGVIVVAAMVIMLFGVSLAQCWAAWSRISDELRVARWPIVYAHVAQGHITAVHQPPGRKHASWDGWCASWDYLFDWQGLHRSGVVQDDTPSPFAPGCFGDAGSARRALTRRRPDSTLPVHVDPTDPWTSTPYSGGVKTSDLILLALGACPGVLAIGMALLLVRGRRTAQRDALRS